MSAVEIYRSEHGETRIEVRFEQETVWLNLNQIAILFGRDKSVISRHLSRIYKEGELDRNSTVVENATVQKEGSKSVSRQIEYYNLDAIISVGYRVNSKQGTQFRIWATNRLREYLMDGLAINHKRLEELSRIVQIIENTGHSGSSELSEAKGLLAILSRYTKSFVLLHRFDNRTIGRGELQEKIIYTIQYDEAVAAIQELKRQLASKEEFTRLFGNQKDGSFKGILGNIIQTFDGKHLYPSIEEQAAHLLYFTIKTHPFSDGNKRIGAFLFVWFLNKNQHLLKNSGEAKINDNALISLALLVARSHPDEKDLMIKLICNLISDA